MKETKIAKENVSKDTKSFWGYVCQAHKQTCQRWLEFLDKKLYYTHLLGIFPRANPNCESCVKNYPQMEKKIRDLKQAIKLYKEAGI